jgi:hypothetical protein
MGSTLTSQVALAFIKAGFPQDDQVLSKAISWLLDENVTSKVTHRFWRLLPIIQSGESFHEHINSDLTHLRESIEKGVKIDPRLNYRAFLLECLAYSKIKRDFEVSEHIAALEADVEKSCSEDALKAIWECTILELSGHHPSRRVINAIVAATSRQVQTRNRLSNFNNNVSATSYCLINVSRSSLLRSRQEIEQIAHQCVEWLLVSQEKKGNWKREQALYGGNPGSAYTTAVALRALLEYLAWRDSKAIGSIFIKDWRRNRGLESWTTRGAVSVAGIAFVIILVVIANNFPDFLIWFAIISGIASIVSIIPLLRKSD